MADKLVSESVGARRALVVAAVATVALYLIPYGHWAVYPLMLFSTYAHEMGHGLAAELVGGDFIDFKMWANGSGVASHAGNYGHLARAFVAAGGLLGPALLAAGFFVLARRAVAARVGLAIFGAMSLIAAAWVVRNGFGLAFVLAFGVACVVGARFANEAVAQFVVLFIAVQLSLTVFSRGDYLFTEYAETSAGRMPSDVAQISKALFGPYWLWGGLVGVASVAVLLLGIWVFFRDGAEPSPRPAR